MTILAFPREHRGHVEVFTVRDRGDGRRLHVFELVDRDEQGPFRIDMAHKYTATDVLAAVLEWSREGVEVHDVGLFL